MIIRRVVVVKVDGVTPGMHGRRIGSRLVARAKAKPRLVLQRANPQAAGVAGAASAVDQPNVVDLVEV